MTERRMMVTIGYDMYIGDPADIASLISIGPRLTRVDHSPDYKSMVLHKDNRHLVQSLGFIQMDYSSVEPQPNAAEQNAIEPASAPMVLQDFGHWLAEVRAMPHAVGDDAEFKSRWERGMSPSDAANDSVPF